MRGANGEDAEIQRPTFVIDLDNIATGWLLFREGQAPERLMDPSLDQPAPSPGEGFKRGFVVATFSPKFFGGVAEFASASIHLANAIKDVYAQYDTEKANHSGKLPVIACTGSPAAISRMEETLGWLRWLKAEHAKLVWARADGTPWKQICWRFGISRATAHRHWRYALSLIAYRLNEGEPMKRPYASLCVCVSEDI